MREYIEQRERDFAQLGCQLDVDHEMKVIKEMYEQARQNDENNDPGTYNNPTAASTANGPLAGKALVNQPSSNPGPDLHQIASRIAPVLAPEVTSHASPTNQPKTEEDLAHSDPMTSDGNIRSATDVGRPSPVQQRD